MTNPEQVLTIAEQYRAQLTEASDKDTIREKQEWYRQQAAPLFKPDASQVQ
jgi:hypothetical protein